jgi:hypothetical protein
MGLAADKSEHFTEALNVSQGGFYFATSAPLQIGMSIEATLRMPAEITGGKPKETHCIAVRALFTSVMNPTATVASVSAPRSKRLFPCRCRIVGPIRRLRLDVHNRFPATHIFKPVEYSHRNGVFAGL